MRVWPCGNRVRSSKPEVSNLKVDCFNKFFTIFVEKDVGWLEVPVDNSLFMDLKNSRNQLEHQLLDQERVHLFLLFFQLINVLLKILI